MRISCDFGFGFTKAENDLGDRTSFPSVVAQRNPTKSGFGGLGGEKDDYSVVIWSTGKPHEAKSYYVGDAAMTAGGAVRTWEEKASENTNILPLIFTSCAILGDGTDIDLAIGLPMTLGEEEFESQRDELKKLLKNINMTTNVTGVGTKIVKINSVIVLRQGVGAYYAACMNINGKIKDIELVKSACGVIDPGQRTTEYLVMVKGKKGITPREDLTGGIDNKGMNWVFEQVQQFASNQAGKEIDILKIEQSILWEKGILNFRGKKIDLSNKYQEACESLAEQIASYIKAKWGNEIDYLSKIMIAGGGGKVLFKYLKLHFPNAESMDSFANAEGYLAFQALITKKTS